jgi:hypothetical protein
VKLLKGKLKEMKQKNLRNNSNERAQETEITRKRIKISSQDENQVSASELAFHFEVPWVESRRYE